MKSINRYFGVMVLGLCWAIAGAQSYSPFEFPCRCPNNNDPVSRDYRAIWVSNGVLGATLGLSGTVTWIINCFPMEDADCTTRPAEGSIQLGTAGGTALLGLNDNDHALTSGYPWAVYPGGMFLSMRVQRGTETQTFVWGRQEGAPSLRFSQAWPGASGYYIRRIWNVGDWDTDLRIDLIQSVMRISVKVRYIGTETATLQLRLASDVEAGVEDPRSYVYAQGRRPIEIYTDLRGADVPPAIEYYLGRGDLRASSRYILRPQPGFPDATPIQRLFIGSWFFTMATSIWEPVFFEDAFVGDFAFALFTEPRVFTQGVERTFVFYVMLTPLDADVQPPLALSVECQPVVEPNTRDLSQLANNGEFTVYASVTNQYFVVGREIDLNNIVVDILLPQQLRLASGQQRTQTIARLAPGETGSVSWRVIADPKFPGFATVRVSAQAPPAPNKSVGRTILISATAQRQAYQGFQLASIPFTTTAPLREVIDLSADFYQAKRWNPARERYEEIDTIQPGQGFWLYLPSDPVAIQLNTDAIQYPSQVFSASVPVPLERGWNQIGNPYPYPLVLGHLVVVSKVNPRESLTFFEASRRGVIRGVLYYWDEFSAQYRFTSDPTTPLNPHRGYWIKANEDIELIFPPVFLPGTGFGGQPPRSATESPASPNEWRLQIIARTVDGEDSENYIGITSGRNVAEVEEPPVPLPQVPVRLSLVKSGTGTPLMQDLRPANGVRHQFEFIVEAREGDEVTLRFPNLRTVPSGYRLRLTDQGTGRTVDLRTTPEYRFVSTGRTRFSLTVERAGRQSALITNLTVSSAGRGVNSVSISYVLSENAQTQVRIVGANGRTVATLQNGRSATRGVNTVVWNLRDDQGRVMPPGTYQVQVEARTEEGQVARMVRPLVLTR